MSFGCVARERFREFLAAHVVGGAELFDPRADEGADAVAGFRKAILESRPCTVTASLILWLAYSRRRVRSSTCVPMRIVGKADGVFEPLRTSALRWVISRETSAPIVARRSRSSPPAGHDFVHDSVPVAESWSAAWNPGRRSRPSWTRRLRQARRGSRDPERRAATRPRSRCRRTRVAERAAPGHDFVEDRLVRRDELFPQAGSAGADLLREGHAGRRDFLPQGGAPGGDFLAHGAARAGDLVAQFAGSRGNIVGDDAAGRRKLLGDFGSALDEALLEGLRGRSKASRTSLPCCGSASMTPRPVSARVRVSCAAPSWRWRVRRPPVRSKAPVMSCAFP